MTELLQGLDAGLERFREPNILRTLTILGTLGILFAFGLTALFAGHARFTPDSWTYIELAKTVLAGDFYAFVTQRSYFSDTYSAAFPLGYPVAVALARLVFGETPMAAVWLNVALSGAIWAVAARVALRLDVPAFASLALATALVLWSPYLGEVFAGRSMPLALLAMLLAVAAWQQGQALIGGMLLGLAAITRFDYLPVALLFLIGLALLDASSRRHLWLWGLGLLLGLIPWVVYSWTHFGRFWVSDNGWVALSATAAYVIDFPARAVLSVLDAPGQWLDRVLGNIRPLLGAVARAVLSFPVLPALFLAWLWGWRGLARERSRRVVLAMLIMAASLAPYLLTGYFDSRYFTVLLGAWSLALAVLLAPSRRLAMQVLLIPGLLLSLLSGGLSLARDAWYGYVREVEGIGDSKALVIEKLTDCHRRQPTATLIFADYTLGARYGAITGMKSAFRPTNFAGMSAAHKQAYFANMEPFLMIDDDFDPGECPIATASGIADR